MRKFMVVLDDSRECLNAMRFAALRAAQGHVVFINSGAGIRANPGWGAYAASKFGLRALGNTYLPRPVSACGPI